MKPCKQCGVLREAKHGKQFCNACARGRQRTRALLCERSRRESAEYRAQQAGYHRTRRLDPALAAEHVARSIAWARANSEHMRFKRQQRRARLLYSCSSGVTPAEWAEIVEFFGGRCAYCLQPCSAPERDHIIPLSRGGLDEPSNVVPACERCNCSKNAAILPVWYARQLRAGVL